MNKDLLVKILASGLFLGYLPYAPGTFGTLAGIPLFLAISKIPPLYYIASTIILFFIASALASKAEIIYQKKDAGIIVIDEVVGFIVTMFLIEPSILSIVLGFILFRFFDIVKIWPASYFNNKHGGYAVVLDDVAAGVYANIALRLSLLIYLSTARQG